MITVIVSFASNEDLLRFYPRNCAEYAQQLYIMGRRSYGKAIDQEMIERQDRILDACLEQFPQK